MALTSHQIDEFTRNGFIIAKVFEPEDLQPVREEIAQFVDQRARKAADEGALTNLHEDKDFYHRMGYLANEYPKIINAFDICNLRGREMFNFMAHPKLMDTLSPLFDGEISCSSVQHLRIKPPNKFLPNSGGFFNVPWHLDSGVAQPESDESLIVTCWCPLGIATEEMGCMQLIPRGERSHLIHESSTYGTQIRPDLMPDTPQVAGECEEGEVVIMNQFIPHSSTPNLSDRCRWTMDMRYQKT